MIAQLPAPGTHLLRYAGETLRVELDTGAPRKGRAVLRTTLPESGAAVARVPGENAAWRDIPMQRGRDGVFFADVPLHAVGVFQAKACFFPEGASSPEWPEGGNLNIKTAPRWTERANSIYTVFTRQFGPSIESDARTAEIRAAESLLDAAGYSAIPPSGTFRETIRRLDHIIDRLGFRIVQLLPVHPVPTTFARMGRFGSAFAALDFRSVDPAYAEFDQKATPLDQFTELADAVHSRGARLFIDLPANHTGWAATLQTHRPEWYRRKNGAFVSPGAWGVTWEDLAELDYSNPGLREYMADTFLFWCRRGVDGFRCDAGYMIPAEAWTCIVNRVRAEFPDTVFMLEGLGGSVETTESLLSGAGLDWAYSELFQTYDRAAFEWYMPRAVATAESRGPLVHFAETHDNDRLAAKGRVYAKMRVALSALLSHQGAWGIANGVEWFADAKIDVHGASPLRWGAADNMCDFISRLNALLAAHPAFGPHTHLEQVQTGGGNFIAVRRSAPGLHNPLLVAVNLDCENPVEAHWRPDAFPAGPAYDLLTGELLNCASGGPVALSPGQVVCLSVSPFDPSAAITPAEPVEEPLEAAVWEYPADLRRIVPVPLGAPLAVHSPHPFRAELKDGDTVVCHAQSMPSVRGGWTAVLNLPDAVRGKIAQRQEGCPPADSFFAPGHAMCRLSAVFFAPGGPERANVPVLFPVRRSFPHSAEGDRIRGDRTLKIVLANARGSSAKVPCAWGTVLSRYDSLLSANPDPNVPADRLALWTRCRIWLQHEGYSFELDRNCTERAVARPGGLRAEWFFRVPCGNGAETRVRVSLSLEDRANAARLEIARADDGANAPRTVRFVMRPNVDWRSFHADAKAYTGPEKSFPAGVKASGAGFAFSPYGGDMFTLDAANGAFHHDPQWTYNVPCPEDAERGQQPACDMFSPGWFSCDLEPGGSCELRGAFNGEAGARPQDSGSASDGPDGMLRLFMCRRDDLQTVIAGFPWFLDWGRDTLIFLRGLIAAGGTEDAARILKAFATFEDCGTIPNIIHGKTVGNRDTSDAPLWLFAATADICAATAPKSKSNGFLEMDCGGRTLLQVLESVADNYIAGTPNGIRVDRESGLVYSPPHFTWMDTNYPACTPREGYPVEIQALWIHALRFLAKHAQKKKRVGYAATAERALQSLEELFPVAGIGLADCLRAAPGAPARSAVREDVLRPNQLLAVTLDGVIPPESAVAREIVRAAWLLVTPGAIRSAADRSTECDCSVRGPDGSLLNNPHNPYIGRYTGDEDTSRKPAYHNGTAWTWQFPMFAEAYAAVNGGTEKAKARARSLLDSSSVLLGSGCLGQLPEITDGDAPHAQKGCCAQAWGASELIRAYIKLGGEAVCSAADRKA